MTGRNITMPPWRRRGIAATALAAGLLVAASTGGAARAQGTPAVQYYFSSSDTSYVPVTSGTFAAGANFTLSIFYTTTGFTANNLSYNAMDVFVGFDRSNTYGTGASPIDNRLTLGDGNDPNAAVTTDPAASGFGSLFPGDNDLTGGQPMTGGAARPYGVDIPLALAAGSGSQQDVTTPTHLLDIMFTNENLAAGPESIVIYNGGTGSDSTTYVTDGTSIYRPNSVLFTAMQLGGSGGATPEPASIVLAAAGLLPAAGLIRRRKK